MLLIIFIVAMLIAIALYEIKYYDLYFEWIEDVNLNKILIVWYNRYTDNDGIIREHKILYDTGRNKK